MTPAQQEKVMNKQMAFFAASNANTRAQEACRAAEATVEAAKADATIYAPLRARAVIQAANDLYFADLSNQQALIKAAQDAQVAESQAQLDLNQAILESRQTDAVEQMPPPRPQQGGIVPIAPAPQV